MRSSAPALCALSLLLLFSSTAAEAQALFIQGPGGVSASGGAVVRAEGPAQRQSRPVAAFSGLRVELPAEVSYRVGGPATVTLYAPANILPLVGTRVDSGMLVLSLERSIALSQPLRVEISGPSPVLLVVGGASDVRLWGASGPELSVELSGAGSLRVDGQVRKFVAVVGGAGNLHAAQLQAALLEANVSGAGTVDAHASVDARLDISGAGGVRVFGNPARRQVTRSDAGSVEFR